MSRCFALCSPHCFLGVTLFLPSLIPVEVRANDSLMSCTNGTLRPTPPPIKFDPDPLTPLHEAPC